MYGVNTGFGLLARTRIEPARLTELQRALVRAYRTFTVMTAGLQDELDDLTLRMWPGATATKAPRHVGW